MRILLLCLISFQLLSQTKKQDTVFCDCNIARLITVNSKTTINKTIAPKGFGSIKEISNTKQNTKFAFEKNIIRLGISWLLMFRVH